MWECPRLLTTLKELSSRGEVGEILLFDNTAGKDIKLPSKVTHIIEGRNTFVNQPWNKGACSASNNPLLVLNDDIWFEWDSLFKLVPPDLIDSESKIGMIGIGLDCYRSPHPEKALFEIRKRTYGYACTFFINQNHWVEIPQEMKIWGGDDWLLTKNREQGRVNLAFSGIKALGEVSLTTRKLERETYIRGIIENDIRLIKKYKIREET